MNWSSLPRELLSAALQYLRTRPLLHPSFPHHPSFFVRWAACLFRSILPRFFADRISAINVNLFRALRYARRVYPRLTEGISISAEATASVLRFLALLDDNSSLPPKPFPEVCVPQLRNITSLPTEILSAILEEAVKKQFSETELGLTFPDAIRPREVTNLLRANEQKLFQVIVNLASVHSSFHRAIRAEKVFKYMNSRFRRFERYLKEQQDFVDEQSRVHRLIYEAIPRTTERLQFLSDMLRDSVDAVAEGSLVYMLTYKYADNVADDAILTAATAAEQAAGTTESNNPTTSASTATPNAQENAAPLPFPSPSSGGRKQARWSIFITYKNVSQSFHDPTADALSSTPDLPAAFPSPFSSINTPTLSHLPFPAWYLRGLAYCAQAAAIEGRQCFQRIFSHANIDLTELQPGTQAYVINVSISADVPAAMKTMASWVWYMRWFALAGEGNATSCTESRKRREEGERGLSSPAEMEHEELDVEIPEAKWVMKEHTRRLCQHLAEGIW